MKLYLLMSLVTVTLHTTREVRQRNGKMSPELYTCTGVFISPTQVLTADHCVADTKKRYIKTANNKSFYAAIVKEDYVKDLAIINITTPYYVYAHIGKQPDISDKVYSVNSGGGLEKTYQEGVIQNIDFYSSDDPLPTIYNSIFVQSGASGSGLFNGSGDLIGILTDKVETGSLAVNTKEIVKFLK